MKTFVFNTIDDINAAVKGGRLEVNGNMHVNCDIPMEGCGEFILQLTVRGDQNVCGNQNIRGNQVILGDQVIVGHQVIGGNQDICGKQDIRGDQIIRGNQDVTASQDVSGNQFIRGCQAIRANQIIGGNQLVQANQAIGGNQDIGGHQVICGDQDVRGHQTIRRSQDVRGHHSVGGDCCVFDWKIWAQASKPKFGGRFWARGVFGAAWQREYYAQRLGIKIDGCYQDIGDKLHHEAKKLLRSKKWTPTERWMLETLRDNWQSEPPMWAKSL